MSDALGQASDRQRLYLDNAATTFPKPPAVMAAMQDYAQRLGASAGRGAYAEAMETGQLLAECRREINALIHGESERHVLFTLNCTDALNLALHGLIDPFDPGHVICSAVDHNSVLRPIHAMAEHWKLSVTIAPIDPATTLLDPDDIRKAIRPDTRYVALTHASNVTGAVQPLGKIGGICREAGVPLILDAAQSLGHVPVDVQRDAVDVLAAPGHKGLLGPLGTGVLYIRPGLESRIRPLREGGTGSRSDEPVQPAEMPDRFEPGSHNAIGLAGLLAGLRWIRSRGVQEIATHERDLVKAFHAATQGTQGLRLFGPGPEADRVGVLSVQVQGYDPQELSAVLETGFGLLTRSGLHCAPLCHRAMGTLRQGGTTRLSVGPFVTLGDMRRAGEALTSLAGG